MAQLVLELSPYCVSIVEQEIVLETQFIVRTFLST